MNSFKKALLATTAIAASFTTSVKADEFRIDRLFVVGDSLSDAGTYSQAVQAGAALGGQQVPNIRYRFTTNNPDGSSQNYAEVLADELGIGPLQPNIINGVPAAAGTPIAGLANDVNVGGTSYAQGGSRVALPALDAATQTPRGITQLPVTQQVDRMLAANPNLGPNDLVVLWAGSNDVLANAELIGHGTITPAQAGQNIVTAASEMIGQVQRVIDAGATNIVVVTVPDIGTSTPLGAGSTPAGQAGLSSLASAYNNALVAGVGGRVTVVNSDAILGDVLANPTRYGFSNANQLATIACPGSALNCITGVNTVANGTIFADPVHPTEQTHRILGQMSAATLVAVGQVGVMPVATITALRQQAIGLENRLSLGSFFMNGENGERIRRPVGNVEIYGGGEVGFYESDAQQVVPGFDAQTQVTKLAADVMVTPNVMIGAGVGLDHGQVEFDNDRGGFDTRLYLGALFGVAQIVPGVYASGVIGGGLIDIYEIERNFDMRNRNGSLIARDSFQADTEGTYVLAKATVGGVLPVGNGFFVNPSVGFTFERVDIDGYSESAIGASTPSLAGTYDDLEYEGHRVTAALGGFYRPPSAPSWVFGLRGSWEHDFNDDKIVVRHANAGMPLAASSSPRPDDSYGFLSGVISKELTHSTALTLQGSTVVGQDGVSGYTVGLLLKHTF